MIEEGTATTLTPFFAPRGIAVVGASDGHERAGARALFNLPHFGYPGAVYPVTRSHSELLGYPCYASVLDVPDPVDLAVICVSAERTPQALREVGERGIRAAVVFAAGFGGDSEAGQRLQRELVAAQRESGVRVIGPNTIGIRVVQAGVFATFAHDIEGGVTPGNVAMIAQSGGLGVYFGSAYLRRREVGTRYLVDTGNELDVGSADVLEYIAQDPNVSCVGLILEGSHDGRRLAAAVRTSVEAGKPVVFLKTGRSAASATHVASHTGALAGSTQLFEAALREAGAEVVDDEVALVDALTIHDAGKAPSGRRLGVVTPSGGYAILTIDAAERFGMELPEPARPPTSEQQDHLRSGTLANPYDYTSIGAAGEQTLKTSIEWMLGQPNVDAVLLWQAYSLLLEDRRQQLEDALTAVLPSVDKPLFGCGITTPEFEVRLRELGVLWFEEPTRLVRAVSIVAPRGSRSEAVDTESPDATTVVAGARARELLRGIEHVTTVEVASAEEAVSRCREWGRAVLKVESDRFPHKTELGLVTGPVDAAAAAEAFETLVAARLACGDTMAAIVAQPFERGAELALGAYLDPTFGPAVMVASGGIFLEVMRDVVFAVAPVDEDHARRLILSLRGAPLLVGERGRPPADVDAAARALVALSEFIAEAGGRFQSVDVNPLKVRRKGRGAVAVDALLVPASGGA